MRRHLQMGNCATRKGIRQVRELACHPTDLQESIVLETLYKTRNGQGEAAALLSDQYTDRTGSLPTVAGSGLGANLFDGANRHW